jgi:hypothetical protein
MEEMYSISDIESPTEEDLDSGLEILIEALKILNSKELLKNIEGYSKKKAEEFRSVKDLRDKFNELAMKSPRMRITMASRTMDKKKKKSSDPEE